MLVIRFANHMITENVQVFWSELQRGEFISDAAVAAGTYAGRALGGSSRTVVCVLVVGVA